MVSLETYGISCTPKKYFKSHVLQMRLDTTARKVFRSGRFWTVWSSCLSAEDIIFYYFQHTNNRCSNIRKEVPAGVSDHTIRLTSFTLQQQQESRRRSGSKRHGPEFTRTGSNNAFRREPLINPGNLHEMRAKVGFCFATSLVILKWTAYPAMTSSGSNTAYELARFKCWHFWHKPVLLAVIGGWKDSILICSTAGAAFL